MITIIGFEQLFIYYGTVKLLTLLMEGSIFQNNFQTSVLIKFKFLTSFYTSTDNSVTLLF